MEMIETLCFVRNINIVLHIKFTVALETKKQIKYINMQLFLHKKLKRASMPFLPKLSFGTLFHNLSSF